jgi:excisionase family DNA binding protein
MTKVYSVGEFADELGVHRETVKKWCREDQIQYSRTPGGHRRIPHTELQRLVGNRRGEAIKSPFMRAFQATLRNKMATSTDNSNRLLSTHTTTVGVLKTNTPT